MAKTAKNQKIASDVAQAAQMAIEIPGAAAVTLSRRLPMLAAATVAPNRHGREINRMVSEKVAAGNQAATAVANGLHNAASLMTSITARQMKLFFSLAPLSSGWLTPGAVMQQADAAGELARISSEAAMEGLSVAATTWRAAVTPVHRKVSANARRLSRAPFKP
jgi:hypothetical protein